MANQRVQLDAATKHSMNLFLAAALPMIDSPCRQDEHFRPNNLVLPADKTFWTSKEVRSAVNARARSVLDGRNCFYAQVVPEHLCKFYELVQRKLSASIKKRECACVEGRDLWRDGRLAIKFVENLRKVHVPIDPLTVQMLISSPELLSLHSSEYPGSFKDTETWYSGAVASGFDVSEEDGEVF
jgi:hypothetical protein